MSAEHPAGRDLPHPARACKWCKTPRVGTPVDGTPFYFCPHCDVRCTRDPSRCARCINVVKAGG